MTPRRPAVLVVLVCLALFAEPAYGQPLRPFQPAEVGVAHYFAAPVERAVGGDVTVALTLLSAGARLPVPVRRDTTTVVVGASFGATSANFTGVPETIDTGDVRDDLYTISVDVGLRRRLSDRWWLVVAPQPGISSDLVALSGDDLLFRGLARIEWAPSDTLLVGAGVLYGTDFGERLTLPLVRIEWDITDSLYLSALIPQRAALMARIGVGAEAGLAGEISGNVFNLNDSPSGAEVVRYSLVTVGPLVRLRLTPAVWLDVAGGVNMVRRFESDVAVQDFEVLEFGETPFIRAAIAVRS